MKTVELVAVMSGVVLSIFTASGQAPDSLEFDVASVKPFSLPNSVPAMVWRNLPDDAGFAGGPGTKDPERINYSGVTLRALLARAYDVKSFQIAGPGWLTTERYVILAKVPHATDAERLRLMLQQLLRERFQLSLHSETRVMPVYRLTVAKNGPKLKPVAEELRVYQNDAERRAAGQARVRAMLETAKAEQLEKQEKGPNGLTGFILFRANAAELAQKLSSRLERPVVEMTQLQGLYDFQLKWVEDTAQSLAVDAPAPTGPSIFTAIQEQLGLKLDAGKEELKVLVIDNALKVPTSN